jgi:hypothetical protein
MSAARCLLAVPDRRYIDLGTVNGSGVQHGFPAEALLFGGTPGRFKNLWR